MESLLRVSFLNIAGAKMAKRKKQEERPVFDSIRKPTAPPSRRIGEEKPDSKAHPAGRKAKHKKKIDPKNTLTDVQ